jgi:hypothetical protein
LKKRNQILYLIVALIVLIIIDRNLWMEDRAKSLFLWESGPGLGDPISYNQDFKIEGSQITFEREQDSVHWPKIAENRKHKFYFAGCYFGSLYMYDQTKGRMAIYEEK